MRGREKKWAEGEREREREREGGREGKRVLVGKSLPYIAAKVSTDHPTTTGHDK